MQLSVILAILCLFYCRSGATGSWGYGHTHGEVYGPADWGHVFKFCEDRHQSPVNIVPSVNVDQDQEGTMDLRVDFQEPFLTNGILGNNGHSPTFSVGNTGGATFKNPINRQTYKLEQFHFHFGCDDSVGSEHTVNGKPYPGEMHMVFYNTKYPDIGTAATQPDGLSVIGVFLKMKHGGNVSKELVYIASQMGDIATEGSTTDVPEVILSNLVPGLEYGSLSYYSYKGSLTTPGCYESVSWFVLKRPIHANDEIFNNFRKLESSHGYYPVKMCNNFRPTQPLNGRRILFHRGGFQEKYLNFRHNLY